MEWATTSKYVESLLFFLYCKYQIKRTWEDDGGERPVAAHHCRCCMHAWNCLRCKHHLVLPLPTVWFSLPPPRSMLPPPISPSVAEAWHWHTTMSNEQPVEPCKNKDRKPKRGPSREQAAMVSGGVYGAVEEEAHCEVGCGYLTRDWV